MAFQKKSMVRKAWETIMDRLPQIYRADDRGIDSPHGIIPVEEERRAD
jgi:hypothetical protein